MNRKALESAHGYLDARARGDSAALRRVTTDSLYAMLGAGVADSSDAAYFRGIGETFRLVRLEPTPCGVTLWFKYREAGERREGMMELTYANDADNRFRVAKMLEIVH